VTVDEFWALIEESGRHSADGDDRAAWLAEQLARRPLEEIVEFQLRRAEVKKAADTWPMWGAAYLICRGWCSDDVFWYFQSWLVGFGRETFERVTADPDALADLPQVLSQVDGEAAGEADGDDDGEDDEQDGEAPQWEALDYVAEDAYARATGADDGLSRLLEERGIDLPVNPEPADDGLPGSQAERARGLPRLSRLFPDEDMVIRMPGEGW
jgi:hypothetical protein